MWELLNLLIAFIILYTVVPWILTFFLGLKAVKKTNLSSKIAFTFDDGPNPKYTPILLDLLKEHHVKATFFVLGSKAEQYPEIIRRMHREGHLIGIHNYVHRSNWIMTPWRTYKELSRCDSIIENIIGEKTVYYRPPWGLLNFFDLFLIKTHQIVLWSLMAGDWKCKGGSLKIKNILLKRLKPGGIILLHDSGETFGADMNAPENTIKALIEVLAEVKSRGLECVRVDDMLFLNNKDQYDQIAKANVAK